MLGIDGLDQEYANGIIMHHRRNDYLGKTQHKEEILVVNEFHFPFPRFDIMFRNKVVILRLQGFGVVIIIGLNPDLVQVGDLLMQIIHTIMYTRVPVRLKIGDGIGN
jgi:hypothetical protein